MSKYEPEINQVEFGMNSERMQPRSHFVLIRYSLREYLAEFIGTLVLVLLGDGVIAQVSINKAAVGSSYLSINLGWALALTMAVYIAGPVSGGHLNPAITIANAIFRKFSWKKVPGYIFSQMLGAFVGAALIYTVYWSAFDQLDGGVRQTVGPHATAGIFACFPQASTPHYSSFLIEMIITGLFMMCILGITDRRSKIPASFAPIAIGMSIGAIGLSVGVMTGYALNPARDLGPRLFTAAAGWGWKPFTAHTYYFWIPVVAPTVGASLGVICYDIFICPFDSEVFS